MDVLSHLISTVLGRSPVWQISCSKERLTCLSQIIQLPPLTNSTFFLLLFRHLYSRGWQRRPREVPWSWCANWRWCSGDSGFTSHPFCRLPQRDEWHWTDMQKGLLTLVAAHVHLRFRGGVRPHLCACAGQASLRVCFSSVPFTSVETVWIYETVYVILICFK